VLTGDYRGRTHGDWRPCLEGITRLGEELRGDIYAILGNHDSNAMVPDLEALGVRMLLNECIAIDRGGAFPGATWGQQFRAAKYLAHFRSKSCCRQRAFPPHLGTRTYFGKAACILL
jgi:hypothetical protein